MNKVYSDLLPLGIGVGIGVLGLWALVHLFPLLIVGGAGYLVLNGLKQANNQETNTQWQEHGQDQKSNSSPDNLVDLPKK